MFRANSNANQLTSGVSFPQKKLMLNGYPAIQYCYGPHPIGSWFTDEIQVLYVKTGTFRMRYGKEEYVLQKGQVVLLKKNIHIEYLPASESLEEEKVEYIQFTIKYELVKEFTKLANLTVLAHSDHTPVIIKSAESGWFSYAGSLDPYLQQEGEPSAGLVKIKMLELFFHLAGLDKCMLEQLLEIREHFRTNITITVEENIMNSMSVEQLATLSGRSLSSFRRDFVAIYNMPPSQWIRMKRLEKAKELLRSTTMTITDICYTLGFENIAHFSRLFKSHFGYPPSGYKLNVAIA
jgi:AraC-like DNA-binding protein